MNVEVCEDALIEVSVRLCISQHVVLMRVAEEFEAAFELGGEVCFLQVEFAELCFCLHPFGRDACLLSTEFWCADRVGIERFEQLAAVLFELPESGLVHEQVTVVRQRVGLPGS
ncbi:hypothetical protein [Nocardia farcinica]|uniref:hypothetical protein n=1 Tax=Nocardia farcinica TaxID=37329 RepID=UPI0024575835|nr:hypothetical protein [Nocardia farcinica]